MFNSRWVTGIVWGLCLGWMSGCDGPPSCPDGGHPEVVHTFVNQGTEDVYLGNIGFSQLQGGEWIAFGRDPGCQVVCSSCTNPCDDGCDSYVYEWCAPVLEHLPPGGQVDVAWGGVKYLTTEERRSCSCGDSEVDCLADERARSGEYKLMYCHAARYTPQDDGCGNEGVAGELLDSTCVDVEFTYDEDWCDGAPIELEVDIVAR